MKRTVFVLLVTLAAACSTPTPPPPPPPPYANDYLTLQGNCDERGSREYNLALGQRRADAVKQRLRLLGIPETRVETVSFGKEKPRELCHNESCWSMNRRVDFV